MLRLDEYERYGRQMVLDNFGLPGQLKLRKASAVVVGAGGLGCPALQYLAAAGVGRIGIIDHDHVELSNLGRQILHTEETIGMYKAESAALALTRYNSHLIINAMVTAITSENASSLLATFDIILDCTDNAPTRYVLSDSAVALGVPLVSGAAQRFEGQLCIYNLGPDGPCYRCLYPQPPDPGLVGGTTCDETGILGGVTGVVGNLQAVEAVKIIVGLHDNKPSLLLYSALSLPLFRSIKLRKRKLTCVACGVPEKMARNVRDVDYVQFCGGLPTEWKSIGQAEGLLRERVLVQDLDSAIKSRCEIYVLDVRPKIEFDICHLPSSINIPLNHLVADPRSQLPLDAISKPIYIICKRGNDSQIAAEALRSVFGLDMKNISECLERENANHEEIEQEKSKMQIWDVIGGLRAWSKEVDASFPIY